MKWVVSSPLKMYL